MISDVLISTLPESPIFHTMKPASNEEDEYGAFEDSFRSDDLTLLIDFTKLVSFISNTKHFEDYSGQWLGIPSKLVSPQLATRIKEPE